MKRVAPLGLLILERPQGHERARRPVIHVGVIDRSMAHGQFLRSVDQLPDAVGASIGRGRVVVLVEAVEVVAVVGVALLGVGDVLDKVGPTVWVT